MAKSLTILCFFLHTFSFQLFSLSAQDSPVVPALYVFGDSTIDAGNNNNLKTNAKANYPFYGIDFNNTPTGRFTNGMTIADFIATFLGLPLPPAYLNLSETARNKVTTGLNYGSASCGVLPDTGSTEGSCLSLDKQIDLFESSIKNVVPAENMELHLAKSIIFISIGSNDYILNYFKNLSSTSTLSPAGFADFLSNEHIKRLQRLYTIGARKFVVNGIGLIGCLPVVMMTVKHGDCVEFMNAAVELYNNQLVSKLQKLQPELRNAIFSYANCFKVLQDLRAMPQKYGIKDVKNPCFVPHLPVCPVRDSHLFFDIAHPSQLPYKIFATLCFNDSSICTPMNIKQLASAN